MRILDSSCNEVKSLLGTFEFEMSLDDMLLGRHVEKTQDIIDMLWSSYQE